MTRLTLDDVPYNNFFIDLLGNFCQKINSESYHIISDKTGELVALHVRKVAGIGIKKVIKEHHHELLRR